MVTAARIYTPCNEDASCMVCGRSASQHFHAPGCPPLPALYKDTVTDEPPTRHTIVGIPPANRFPARVSILPQLPASATALYDLAHNALRRPEDLCELNCSEPHLVAVLQLLTSTESLHERQAEARDLLLRAADQIVTLRQQLAAAQGVAAAYGRAYEGEREAKAALAGRLDLLAARVLAEAERAHDLLELNERQRHDSDAFLRCTLTPPPDDDPFGEPMLTRVWANGTNPGDDTEIVEVDHG